MCTCHPGLHTCTLKFNCQCKHSHCAFVRTCEIILLGCLVDNEVLTQYLSATWLDYETPCNMPKGDMLTMPGPSSLWIGGVARLGACFGHAWSQPPPTSYSVSVWELKFREHIPCALYALCTKASTKVFMGYCRHLLLMVWPGGWAQGTLHELTVWVHINRIPRNSVWSTTHQE